MGTNLWTGSCKRGVLLYSGKLYGAHDPLTRDSQNKFTYSYYMRPNLNLQTYPLREKPENHASRDRQLTTGPHRVFNRTHGPALGERAGILNNGIVTSVVIMELIASLKTFVSSLLQVARTFLPAELGARTILQNTRTKVAVLKRRILARGKQFAKIP